VRAKTSNYYSIVKYVVAFYGFFLNDKIFSVSIPFALKCSVLESVATPSSDGKTHVYESLIGPEM